LKSRESLTFGTLGLRILIYWIGYGFGFGFGFGFDGNGVMFSVGRGR